MEASVEEVVPHLMRSQAQRGSSGCASAFEFFKSYLPFLRDIETDLKGACVCECIAHYLILTLSPPPPLTPHHPETVILT